MNNQNSAFSQQSRPKGFGSLKFAPPQAPFSMDEEMPPGTLPNQFPPARPNIQPMSFGQFNPYSGGNRNIQGLPGGLNFALGSQQGMSSPIDGLHFRGSSPSSASHSTDSSRFLSPSSSSGSLNTPARMTPEHIIRSYSQESVGKLKLVPDHEAFDFVATDLMDHGEIGRGAFGSVNRMTHRNTSTEMAVKRIRSTVDEREQKRLLMDLDVRVMRVPQDVDTSDGIPRSILYCVSSATPLNRNTLMLFIQVMRSSDCPYIVKFYGALFWEGDCWICMELMSTSLDKFYRFVYHRQSNRIHEGILSKVAVATVKALDYLKEKLQIIHRDVKPSNILIDRGGNIKLCDFGISGHLVNSIARTRDAGCQPYMAPERIDTSRSRNGYDVRSDVWSLGITLIELATGKFPYPKWNNVFDQLTQVVRGDPPKLQRNVNGLTFSDGFVDFVNMMTIADSELRPKYDQLLSTVYLRNTAQRNVDVASYFCAVLDVMTPSDFLGGPAGEDAFR